MERSDIEKEMLVRAEAVVGSEGMERIKSAKVILFGVGGVGSWCAESLVRTGVRHLTMVDGDSVCLSNCNRQLMATSQTIGQPKVEAMRERLLRIHPDADIQALTMVYNEETAESFHLEEYDYVIDAIDSLADKAHLILRATSLPGVHLFSSMGAALRMDPFRVREAEFWNVKGDALARALRNRFKKAKTFPQRKFRCVYSEEPPMPLAVSPAVEGNATSSSEEKATPTKGSLSHVTGVFGFALAGMVIRDLSQQTISTI